MPPPEGNLQNAKDLDSVVSSFLAELDALSVELQPAPAESTVLKPAPEPEPVPAPASTSRAPQTKYIPVVLLFIFAIVILAAGLLHFRSEPAKSYVRPPAPSPRILKVVPPVRGILNDTALLLAGRPVSSESSLSQLSRSPLLQRHRKEMQLFWSRIREGNLARIRQWQEKNIPGRLGRNPVLYPLSGADYLNAYAFFPRAPEYLLLSLEPPGEIPDLTQLEVGEIEASLSAVRSTVQSIASVNYLQSRAMREELTNSSFHGVAPLIILFAAGFGHTILDVQPVKIGEEGSLTIAPSKNVPTEFHRVAGVNVPNDTVCGVRIRFIDGVEGTEKSITYLQIELKNDLFKSFSPESRYLRSLKNRNAILKSAVYLLHGSGYSTVSEYIRSSSDLVIQDDSGIPFSHFTRSQWEEHLFGTYTRPEPLGTLTNPPRQPLLAEQYAQGSSPLEFSYGYGALWGAGRSNLMLFVKK